MAYCTQSDITVHLGYDNLVRLTNDAQGAVVPNYAVMNELIAHADTIIDATLNDVYQVPFATAPPIIKLISTHLACFFILQRKYAEAEMPKIWQQEYTDAISLLQKIDDLEIDIDAPTLGVVSPTGTIVAPVKKVDFDDTDNQLSYF